jgi:MscS family membrane protein
MIFRRKSQGQGVRLASAAVLWVSLIVPVAAQIPGLGSSTTPPPQEQVKDPFGRSTPRGTIIGFTRAAYSGNFVSAARHMQIPPQQRRNTEKLARDLNELMDRYFDLVASVSNSPEGALDDGLPLDREKVGPLEIGGEPVDIGLVRVKDPDYGQIWLIASETVARVPALHKAMENTWIERVMPEALLKYKPLGISLAQYLAWAASIGLPLLLFSLLSFVALVLARKIIHSPRGRRVVDSWYGGMRWPAILVLVLGIHLASLPALGFSLRFRILYARTVAALLIITAAFLIHRLTIHFFDYICSKMQTREYAGTRSLLLLGERVVNALIIAAAVLSILTLVGIDTGTVLAGLGIAGVAVAFGAQKTVENLIGGLLLLADRALAVGDMCRISEHFGAVEDITLRSVRLRTLEQTLLVIPAGILSQSVVENFTTRGKILMKTTLRLRYGTSTEQVRTILDETSTLLSRSPEIETGSSRVRLVDFGLRAIELELFAYVLTSEILKFLAVREELLLQIAGIVEATGSGFARPEIVEAGPVSTPFQEKQGVG